MQFLITRTTFSQKYSFTVERATGIEPATEGWKPTVLPLNYTRIIWLREWDLNPRQMAYETTALTRLSYAQTEKID